MATVGRPPALDETKKREICALVFAGCSRDVAAQYVGCSRRTVRNAALRDPAFAGQLRRVTSCGLAGQATFRRYFSAALSSLRARRSEAPAKCPQPGSSGGTLRDETAHLCNGLVEALVSGRDLRRLLNAARTAQERTRGQCAGDTRREPRDVAGPSEFVPRAACNNSADREENMPPLFPGAAPQSPQNGAELPHPQGNKDVSFGPQSPEDFST